MSEGWGDFIALHMALREGDDLTAPSPRASTRPKLFGDTGYFGIRRFPYSVDFTKNALTFKHIPRTARSLPAARSNANGVPNAEVHNAGEVWATMLFEALRRPAQAQPGDARLRRRPARRSPTTWCSGLQLAPIDATFTDTATRILTAVEVVDPDDVPTVRRGVRPPRAPAPARWRRPSVRFEPVLPVTESFAVAADHRRRPTSSSTTA